MMASKGCCKDWEANCKSVKNDGKAFERCPWCDRKLIDLVSIEEPKRNEEPFRLVNWDADGRAFECNCSDGSAPNACTCNPSKQKRLPEHDIVDEQQRANFEKQVSDFVAKENKLIDARYYF